MPASGCYDRVVMLHARYCIILTRIVGYKQFRCSHVAQQCIQRITAKLGVQGYWTAKILQRDFIQGDTAEWRRERRTFAGNGFKA